MHMLRKKCHELDGMGLMNDNDWLFHSYGVFESSDDAHFLLSNIKTERSVEHDVYTTIWRTLQNPPVCR